MNRRITIAAVLVLAFGALPLAAQGQRGPGRPGPGGPGPMGILPGLNQVGLTDAQREQIRDILDEERQAGADPAAQGRQAEQGLLAAVLADAPNPQAIESARTAVSAARAGELDHRIELMQKVAQILTPAQRQQLAQLPPPGPGRGRGGRSH